MARARKSGGGIRGTRAYQAVERALLSFGMAIVASFIERRLLKALKSGGVKPAPRTLAEREDYLEQVAGETREGSFSSGYGQPPA